MKESNTQKQAAQELDYFKWISNPENLKAIGRVWSEEWEGDYWAEDEPEEPLDPSEQAEVDKYYPLIIHILEARHIVNEAVRQREVSNWGGTSAFLNLYDGTVAEERTTIIRAMGKAIENAEQHPETSAEVLSLVTNIGLTQVEGSIKRLSRTPLATQNEAIRDGITHYKATRILDTLTYGKQLEIYERLTAATTQTLQQ